MSLKAGLSEDSSHFFEQNKFSVLVYIKSAIIFTVSNLLCGDDCGTRKSPQDFNIYYSLYGTGTGTKCGSNTA